MSPYAFILHVILVVVVSRGIGRVHHLRLSYCTRRTNPSSDFLFHFRGQGNTSLE